MSVVRSPPLLEASTPRPNGMDVYSRDTIVKLVHNDTPVIKRRKMDDAPPSANSLDDAVLVNLVLKMDEIASSIAESNKGIEHLRNENTIMRDQLFAAISKSDDKIEQLRKDNISLRDDLKLIKNLIQTISSKNSSKAAEPISSYAKIVKSKDVVIIEPKDISQDFEQTKAAISQSLNPVEAGVRGIKKGARGKVVIECQSILASENISKIASNSLGSEYIVKTPKKRNPKVRIYGIRADISEDNFLHALKTQNNHLFSTESSIKILHKFSVQKDTIRYGFKCDVDPKTFQLLIEAQNIYIGWDKCWINEEFNLVRCFKCWDFHHTSNKCTNSLRCSKCGGDHLFKDCKTEVELCCVCLATSTSSRLNIDTAHNAKSSKCPTYQHKLSLEKQNINYL